MGVKVSELDIEVKSNLKDIEKPIKRFNNAVGNAKKEMKGLVAQMQEFSKATTDTVKATKKVKDSAKETGTTFKKLKEKIGTGWDKVKSSFKNFGEKFKKSSSGISKILKSFVRIGFYRIIRTIFSTITGMLKQGTENAYLFARAMGMGVASTLDKVSTEVLYIKNQFGAVGVQILASLLPVIQRVADYISVATEYLSKFFAVLNGGNEYLVATRNAKAFAKAQRDILGFDEINKLSGDTTNNLYSFITKTVEGEELGKLKKAVGYFQIIKNLVEKIALALLGWKLAKTFTDALGITGGGGILGLYALGAVLTITLATKFAGDGTFNTESLKKIIIACFGVGVLSAVAITAFTGNPLLGVLAFTVGCLLTLLVSTKIEKAKENLKQKVSEVLTPTLEKINEFAESISLENTKGLASAYFSQYTGNTSTGTTTTKATISDRLNTVKKIGLTTRANGGFVDSGQLFLARENGAEMVGSIGNRTAVANNDQIVEAIKQGVYEAMSRANGNVNVTLQGDAKGLFKVIQQQAKQYAYATGNNAF